VTRILLTAATVANLFALPALAQSPASGSRTTVETPSVQAAARQRAGRRATPAGAATQSPAGTGQRWPGAKYDENGYYIDPNSRGRW
jgi:hypothetical protein